MNNVVSCAGQLDRVQVNVCLSNFGRQASGMPVAQLSRLAGWD